MIFHLSYTTFRIFEVMTITYCWRRSFHYKFIQKWKVLSRSISNQCSQPQIAIVGSGPAGFYTAKQILKDNKDCKVDIYEKFPVPFGLVRYGIAPDHPEVKNVENTFTKVADNDNCTFIGNVHIGRDVTIQQLRNAYTAVVLAYGSSEDKKLNLPGEDLKNVLPARRFVGWYNGLPDDKDLDIDLNVENVAVFGHGNVALDVARVLLQDTDSLKKTDIPDYALDKLITSKVKNVYLIGRRGPLQVAFTIAEMREMLRIYQCKPYINPDQCQGLDEIIKDIPRFKRRLTSMIWSTACDVPKGIDTSHWKHAKKSWHLNFLRSPTEFISDNEGSVSGVKLVINKLEGSNFLDMKAVPTGETEIIKCGLVLKSIGYASVPLEHDLPFDHKTNTIPNVLGRVVDKSGLYCSGWVKRGPVGVIVTTMTDAFETGRTIVQDISDGSLNFKQSQIGKEAILSILQQNGIKPVFFHDWEKINEAEVARGRARGKSREKFDNIEEMMDVVK